MTSSRARRPVLPVLTAVLAGALVAGAATMVSDPPASSADEGGLSFAAPDAPSAEERSGGGLERGAPGTSTSGTPTTSAPPTTSTTAPPSSTPSTPPTSTSTAVDDPEPSDPPTEDPEPPPAHGSQRDQVVQYVNWARQERGCRPVQVDSRLTAAAQGHSEDMSNRDYFSHTTPEGVTFDQRIRNAGYPSPGAENIARGADSAEKVMRMWMESDGHRRNILNCDLRAIGVGLDTDGWYWVQNFGW